MNERNLSPSTSYPCAIRAFPAPSTVIVSGAVPHRRTLHEHRNRTIPADHSLHGERRCCRPSGPPRTPGRRSFRRSGNCSPLSLERLEDRTLLSATVITDKLDYPPGETAVITGTEFLIGETVELQVVHTDGTPNTGGGHDPWYVTDGGAGDLDGVADGAFRTTWYVNPDDQRRLRVPVDRQQATRAVRPATPSPMPGPR